MMKSPVTRVPLVIAAHGTRSRQGLEQCRSLVRRVADKLPGITVTIGYVELAEPGIADMLSAVLSTAESTDESTGASWDAVVVPLMLNTGGHVRMDIPEAIDAGRGDHPVAYAHPLSPDVRLRHAMQRRIREALNPMGEPAWRADETTVVVVGRGALVPEANASHYHLTRMIWEELQVAQTLPAFIQVNRPSVPEALNMAFASGAEKIVVAPNFLFPGKLSTWLGEQVDAWCAGHPGMQVRLGEALGDCDEVASVVVDRYRAELDEVGLGEGAPVYLSGLRLDGRDVLVVGAGHVAERRIPWLLDAGARVRVVAPNAGNRVAKMAREGLVAWQKKGFEPNDVAGAWFVQALSNDPQVNAAVVEASQRAHVFCVRGDRAEAGSAYTPATAQAAGLTVGVVGDRTPRRSAAVRDELLKVLQG